MRLRHLFLLLHLCLLGLLAATAAAQDKPKEGGDAVQGFQSPLQVGSGATLLVTQDKTSLTAGLSGQMPNQRIFNAWQLGITGTINDEGEALVYSTSDTAAPGFKAKVGVGYSSFLSTSTRVYTSQAGQFLTQAWCVDVLSAVGRSLKPEVTYQPGQSCQAFFNVVNKTFASAPPAEEEAAKTAKAVIVTLEPLVSDLTAEKRAAACEMFKNVAKDGVFKLCLASGEPQKSAEDQKKNYPELYQRIVLAQLPTFYYTIFGNYQPTLSTTAYRDVIDGKPDLTNKHQWTRMMQGASLDTTLYYGRFAAGIQVAFLETAEIKLSQVCKVQTEGDYRAETCKDAMLGKPDPSRALSLSTVFALDPLIMPKATTLARPGAQLEFRYERPTDGHGHKSEIALPLFLAPVESPLKLVVGVRPTWTKNTTGDDPERHFSVFFFIGARPGPGKG